VGQFSVGDNSQQSGHQSEAVMQRYIRDGQLFTGNPLGKMW